MTEDKYSEYFDPRPDPRPELLSGSAAKWYETVVGEEFICEACGEQFTVDEDMVALSSSGDAPSMFDKLKGYVGGGNAYGVSDETVENGLFTADETLVQGVIVCPFCLQQHGHHYNSVIQRFGFPN